MINASPGKLISIGYEGEDKVTKIVFRYDEDWLACGDGVFKVRVKRPCDAEAYNATQIVDDREAMMLTMTITDIELSVKGHGEIQIAYIGADFVKKSPVYRYNVARAIDSEVVNPPRGSIINELVQSVGDLDELTTTNKDSLVEAINEVNAKEGGGSITIDDEFSGTSENPVQNKVIKARLDSIDGTVAGIGGRLATAETTLEGKANTADVNTALSTKANSSDVNSALALKANTADMNTALASKANSADVQTALAGKASTDVATQSANGLMSSADKTKLDGLGNSGVSDVQVNGASVVTDGVADIPIAGSSRLGAVKTKASLGISINGSGELMLSTMTLNIIKGGSNLYYAVSPGNQHQATFYGLAKVAGYDEKNSTLPVGTYTEEAKTAIRTMLGLEEMYQWYRNNSGN